VPVGRTNPYCVADWHFSVTAYHADVAGASLIS
jgi:hypothetical protein